MIIFPHRCVSKACANPITANDYLIAKTHGAVEFTDKMGRLQRKEGLFALRRGLLEVLCKRFQL